VARRGGDAQTQVLGNPLKVDGTFSYRRPAAVAHSELMLTLPLPAIRRLLGTAAAPVRQSPNLIYRLRAWPELAESRRTADLYQVLSVMSNRPVTRQWIALRMRCTPEQVDALLRPLIESGAVDVIDPARFDLRP
jgi:hypothetical protein